MSQKTTSFLSFSTVFFIFLIECILSPGWSFWVLYFLPAIVFFDNHSPRSSFLFTALITSLMIIGFLLPPYAIFQRILILNRLAGIVSLWLVSIQAVSRVKAHRLFYKTATLSEAILTNMTEGLIVSNRDGKIVKWNKAAETICKTGALPLYKYAGQWKLRDLYGNKISLNHWPLSRVLRGEKLHDQSLHLINTRTLESSYISVSGIPIFDKQGNLEQAVIMIRDITAIIETENKLKDALETSEKRAAEIESKGRLLNVLMEQVPEVLFITGPLNQVLYVSRFSEKLLEMPLEEIINTPEEERPDAWGLFHPDGKSASFSEMPLYQAVHMGVTTEMQEWLIKRNGRAKTVLVNTRPILDPQGRIRGAVSGWRDISEIKRILSANIDQKNFLESILDNIPIVVLLFNCHDQRLLFVNTYYYRISRFPGREILGKKIQEAWPDLEDRISPILEKVCIGNESYKAENMELKLDTEKGQEVIFISFELIPLPSHDSEKTVLAIIRETTEAVETQRRIEQTVTFDEAILSNITDSLFIFDGNGKLLKTNPEAIKKHGLPEDITELLKVKSVYGFLKYFRIYTLDGQEIPPDKWPSSTVLKGENLPGTEVVVRVAGKEEWIASISGVPVKKKNGRGEMGIITIRDVTSTVKVRREMEYAVARYESIVNYMTDGLIIADPQGEIQYMNPAVLRISGFKSVEEIPKRIQEYEEFITLYDIQGKPLPTDDWPLSRALRGENFTGLEISLLNSKTGSHIIANFSGALVFDKDGKRILAILTMRDVTELRARTREAEESKRILDAMLEHIPLGVVIADSDLQIKMTSRFNREQLGEHTWLLHKEGSRIAPVKSDTQGPASCDNHPLCLAVRKGVVTSNEEWILRNQKGDKVTALFNASPLIDNQGIRVGGILMWVDISARKHTQKVQERLLSQNRRQRAFLETLIEIVPAGIAVIRTDRMDLEFVNSFFRSMLMKSRLDKGEDSPFLPDLIRSRKMEQINISYRERRAVSEKEIPLTIDQKTTYWNLDYVPVTAESGRVEQILVVAVNITDLVENRKCQEFLTVWFRTIVNSVIESLITIGPDGKLLEINPAAFRFLHIPPDLIHKHYSSLSSYFELRSQDGKAVPSDRHPITRVLRGETVSREVMCVKIRETGEIRYAMLSGTTFSINSENATYAVMNINDITDLILTQEQLRDQRNFINAIFDAQGAMVALLDKDGNVLKFNKTYELVTGLSASDTKGHHIWELLLPGEKEQWMKRLAESHDRTVPVEYENFIRTRSGKERFIRWRNSVLTDKEGNITHIIVTGIDLSDRLEAEERIKALNSELQKRATDLEFANKELESFSYSVSHDLRSPLSTIGGFISLLKEDYESLFDAQGREYLKTIQSGIRKMNGIIGDMLQLSRISRKELIRSRIDMSKMVSEFLEDLRRSEPQRRAEFKIQENITAYADSRLVYLALENLLRNAWKFTSRKDKTIIEFGVFEQENETVYFVKDNGAGFDMQKSEKLFAPFQRLHSEKEYSGTGIGLPIVMRVIRRHGGRIWAHGEMNKGAVFYFTLS